jgi:hypothetical protein
LTQQLFFFEFNPNKKIAGAKHVMVFVKTTNYGISHIQLQNYSIQNPDFQKNYTSKQAFTVILSFLESLSSFKPDPGTRAARVAFRALWRGRRGPA